MTASKINSDRPIIERQLLAVDQGLSPYSPLERPVNARVAAGAFGYIEIVWAPVDGAQAALVCVFEDERRRSGIRHEW